MIFFKNGRGRGKTKNVLYLYVVRTFHLHILVLYEKMYHPSSIINAVFVKIRKVFKNSMNLTITGGFKPNLFGT